MGNKWSNLFFLSSTPLNTAHCCTDLKALFLSFLTDWIFPINWQCIPISSNYLYSLQLTLFFGNHVVLLHHRNLVILHTDIDFFYPMKACNIFLSSFNWTFRLCLKCKKYNNKSRHTAENEVVETMKFEIKNIRRIRREVISVIVMFIGVFNSF